ncbi:hypothetical protein V1478_017096 [Vespula squamosa]|uniref:Uncharacterized protein n=1 Tax=Vespula squamosa TaxID=30214 RepID=A0ABD1ZYF4_VESSQ
MGLRMQQPPRGETWVGITCDVSKSNVTQVLPGGWLHISLHFPNFFLLILTTNIKIILSLRRSNKRRKRDKNLGKMFKRSFVRNEYRRSIERVRTI